MQNFKESGDLDQLKFIINHVFLPPELPQEAEDDKTLAGKNFALLSLLLENAKKYQHELVGSSSELWRTVVGMLSNLCKLQGRSSLSKTELSTAINLMHPGDVLAIHITAQNAGIILQHLETEMLFLSFEASPTSAAVMGTTGKLLCSYPGPAIAVPLSKAKDPTFLEEFASFAEKMDRVVLQDAIPVSKKAGSEVPEERDTVHPKFITEMLTGILRAIGRPADDVKRFRKRVADEVLWDNAKLPWRRSPLWLVVRVALQVALKDSTEYKSFMIFFLADILELAVKSCLSSDLLFVMNAKLSRRAYKLDHIPQFVLTKAYRVTTMNNRRLNNRWTQIQKNHSEPLSWAPQELSFEKDSCLSLQNSRQYLAAVMGRKVMGLDPSEFKVTYTPRNSIAGFSGDLPSRNLMNTSGDERYTLLADFELWVQENLDRWVAGNKHREEACRELSGWIDDYTVTAKSAYQSNPESMSIMLLTTYELWVAMDKVAVNHYPLLSEYAPELVGTDKLFGPLLLPRYQQMERLHLVEAYLGQRRVRANSSNTSIFSDYSDSSCFAVRYFRQSALHQQLERRIESDAEREKRQKVEEFNRKRREYDDLVSRASGQSCTQYWNYRGWYQHPSCSKCSNEQSARAMRIEFHEWPLPKDHIKRMAVVFELQCPMGFSIWRDTTYKILTDICTPPRPEDQSPGQPFEQLWDYSGLSRYYESRGQRLAWSSSTKSFRRSHFDSGFPTSVDIVCVDNALNYSLFDTGKSEWARECLGRFDVRKFCTFSLPEGPYRVLQYAVDGTSHTSNDVISNQKDCPAELSLHEYYSFCTLRAGHRLQWLNIARELRTNTLTFSDEAVNLLLMQAAWQAGPPDTSASSIYRECHIDLERLEFGRTLLGELERMLTSIEANWLESISAKVLIHLTTHLLSVNKHSSITNDAFSLLRRARGVTLDWTRQLVKKLQECEIEESMKDLQLRVLQMAAICRATYDVDNSSGHLEGVLSSAEDVAILIECATIVHDNTPVHTDSLPLPVRHLLDRDRRLSHTLERYIREQILRVTMSEGFNQSAKQVYRMSGSSWDSVPGHSDRWMMSKRTGDSSQRLYYNLLSGQLLVDGEPVGRMPENFVSHATYQRVFRERVLDVLPSDMAGMRYRTRHEISGHQVHFSMLGGELVVRTRVSENAEIYELVPHTKLSGDFPVHFVEEYMHWLNVGNGDLEFRPLSHPWEIRSENWHISYSLDGASYMHRGNENMLDVRSDTASMIGSILSLIENPDCIEIRFRVKDESVFVSANLPRLKLEFFMNGNQELECRQFRGAIIDTDQNIGTMNGLVNRLVLLQSGVRIVIFPCGEVTYQSHENHVIVHINTGGLTRVKYYSYNVDSRLGRLSGNGSLASHLYKIYLHAVTAHCLPDPLTSRTGTEEALDNLRSATTWSFQKLQPEEIQILRLIASLTPTRVYYPEHLEVMQSVHWKSIPPVMQHDEFHEIVVKIFAHATQFHVFREDTEAEDTEYYQSKSNGKLLSRAAIRNAIYRRDEFGGSLSGIVEDTPYVARDSQIDEFKETQVCSVANAVKCWSPDLDISRQIMGVLEGWQHLKGVGSERIRLGYDYQWVNPGLAAVWGSIYDACRKSERDRSTYQMMFFLSTLTYSGRVELPVIGSLLAFATIPQFQNRNPPPYSSYNLADGYAPDERQLKGIVDTCSVRFDWSQEANLVARSGETEAELWRRQNSTYTENLELQSRRFVASLISQWPCASPSTPYDMDYRLLTSSKAMDDIRPMFDSWYRNKMFREHISEVQSVLNSIYPAKPILQKYIFQPCNADPHRVVAGIRFEDLVLRDSPSIPESPNSLESPNSPELPNIPQSPVSDVLMAAISTTVSSSVSLSGTVFSKLRNSIQKIRKPWRQTSISKVSHETASKSFQRKVEPRTVGSDLKLLLDGFKAAHSREFEKQYTDSMFESLKALEEQVLLAETLQGLPSKSTLESALAQCEKHMEDAFRIVQDTLAPLREVDDLMDMAGLWPCISPISLLQQLSTNASVKLSTPWKRALISYGKAIAGFQRSERLLTYNKLGKEREFHSEVANTGHQEWDPMVHPDWLLIEIENNFLVRQVQNQIASEMMKPTSKKNQTLQLNMGEGKSSVIVPIVATALADGGKLVRVVVLKPLSTQMFRLLVQKLSGLTNRRIFYMPFSRSVKLDKTKATHMRQLYDECMRVRGVLLVQPEHILSFKLIGLERLYQEDKELASVLLDTQHWLEKNTRDILDESDEILHVRHELIYTIGEQQSLESSPDRWVIVQEIFGLVKFHMTAVSDEFPQGLEFETGLEAQKKTGCFPIIRILKPEAGKELLLKVASDIVKGLLPTVSFRLFPADIRELALSFITDTNITLEHVQPLLDYCGNDTSMAFLLLLRGLIAENILFFALKEKRWRVDYGLTPNRIPKTSLAVPFRAKDVPAPRAEFSHPDVAITLTCLSYYYTGLNDSQLRDCFKILIQLSNPVVQYEEWIQGLGDAVPETLRKLNGINLLDNEECANTVFPLFRFNKSVIDFYLSHAIFPKEAKEFPYKLSSSGWDIAQAKTHPTTGFSGTNDNRDLLPLSVCQHAPPEQLNTNAKVLSYLLQVENSYMCAKDSDGERLNVDALLKMLVRQNPQIRVLLDVGAQVLECGNDEVAVRWLSLVPESKAQAVVFFNENDELIVLSRDGSREPYEISVFAKQMDQCLVYLDEVHTRGTDLKLPRDSRAAVTLGPNLTKDRLVQACMRMRMLGHGQSVLFCAPPEIERKILGVISRSSGPVNVSDVLHWCMVETCTSNRNNVPIWAKQGISYHRRHLSYCDIQNSDVFPPSLREPEAQTLDQRFGLQQSSNDVLFGPTPPELEGMKQEMESIRARCALFDVSSLWGSHAQEEQERELSYEVELEQQVERPPRQEPLVHRVHDDVVKFIEQGIINSNSTSFVPAFRSLSQSSAGNLHEHAWSPSLLATKDFAETIKIISDSKTDEFLRPVHWVLSTSTADQLVVMSPYEVNELIPRIRRSSSAGLHIYSPKVTKGMQSFLEDLSSWTISPAPHSLPDSLVDELNIFAGQLYLKDDNAYQELCGFLGLYLGELPADKAVKIHSDGFVEPGSRMDLGMVTRSPFPESPVVFLRRLMGFRRKDQDYLATHLGQILHGRLLTAQDFDV